MTSRHPAVSCACPKCQSERRTTPPPATDANPFVGTNWQVRADTPATDTPGTYGTMTPTIEVVPPHYPLATEEREAVAQWCSGCHEVRSVDCYRADCPKSDTERRAAEILAAEEREAVARAIEKVEGGINFDYLDFCRDAAAAALSALAPVRAAEILAAEANERARIVAWLDEQYCLNDDCRLDMIAAIKRNEHGAGK